MPTRILLMYPLSCSSEIQASIRSMYEIQNGAKNRARNSALYLPARRARKYANGYPINRQRKVASPTNSKVWMNAAEYRPSVWMMLENVNFRISGLHVVGFHAGTGWRRIGSTVPNVIATTT